jgi:uridine kinase
VLSFAAAVPEVSAALEELDPVQRPRFIAIDGLTSAGKTTFGAYLAAGLGAALLHTDDFAHAGPELWDHARFHRRVWEPLAAGRAAAFTLHHWSRGPAGEAELPPETRIVVVEGLRSLDRAVATPWDLTVWVKTDEAIRLERARTRDGGARWECWSENWAPKEADYVRVQEPEERADFIVDGTTGPKG